MTKLSILAAAFVAGAGVAAPFAASAQEIGSQPLAVAIGVTFENPQLPSYDPINAYPAEPTMTLQSLAAGIATGQRGAVANATAIVGEGESIATANAGATTDMHTDLSSTVTMDGQRYESEVLLGSDKLIYPDY